MMPAGVHRERWGVCYTAVLGQGTLGPFDTAATAERARHLCLAQHELAPEQVVREVNRQAVLAGQCTSRYRGVVVLGDGICLACFEHPPPV